MRFYRGIAVPRAAASNVVTEIRARGLNHGDGHWTMLAADLKPQLPELWRRQTLTLTDTRPQSSKPTWVCACAEPDGALYYACSHNKVAHRDTPILIEFEAPVSDAIVDGRDFLYTIFQFGNPAVARPIVARIFGTPILKYADRAWSALGSERIAICDLAVQDECVISAHAANSTVIAGRYNTIFRSAFLVRTPVTAERIVDVHMVTNRFRIPGAHVQLRDLVLPAAKR